MRYFEELKILESVILHKAFSLHKIQLRKILSRSPEIHRRKLRYHPSTPSHRYPQIHPVRGKPKF